jgi:hypothetical protein
LAFISPEKMNKTPTIILIMVTIAFMLLEDR